MKSNHNPNFSDERGLRRFFPNASAGFISANLRSNRAELPSTKSQPSPPRKRDNPLASRKEGSQERPKTGLVITSHRVNLLDPDNVLVKPLVDALRYAGLIEDDSLRHITLDVQQVKVGSYDEEKTVVEIFAPR